MRGFYFCNNCNLFIEVMSYVRTRNVRQDKVMIPFCCHCKGKIKEVEPSKYNKKRYGIYSTLFRTYNIRGKEKKVELKVKFLNAKKKKRT